MRGDPEAPLRQGPGLELAPQRPDPLAHPDQPMAAPHVRRPGDARPHPIVDNLDPQRRVVPGHGDAAVGRGSVPNDVRQGFLDDPVHGNRQTLGQPVDAVEMQVDVHAGPRHSLDEGRQLPEPRSWGEVLVIGPPSGAGQGEGFAEHNDGPAGGSPFWNGRDEPHRVWTNACVYQPRLAAPVARAPHLAGRSPARSGTGW